MPTTTPQYKNPFQRPPDKFWNFVDNAEWDIHFWLSAYLRRLGVLSVSLP